MSKKEIEKLTPEQEKQLKVYYDKWLKIGTDSKPADRKKAEELITRLYKNEKYDKPKFLWFRSPFEAAKQIKEDLLKEGQTSSPLMAACFGQHSAGWLSFYDYCFNVLGIEKDDSMECHLELAKCCGWFFTYDTTVYCCEKTKSISIDENERLHNENGPALEYRDGEKVYSIHGVVVPEKVIMNPETITSTEVLNERNVEVRRIMLDRMGHEKFMEQANPEVLDSDVDEIGNPRRLLKVPIENDEDMVVAQVINSSLEPDGTAKTYYLRVPPDMTDIKEAVAWTFGLSKEEYNLVKQS